MTRAWPFSLLLLTFSVSSVFADQVIMKDGTVYKGKIQIDTDKAVVIGNPPFDPESYYLETKDIEKIIYEEYRLKPPAERKRGFLLETALGGRWFSSDQFAPDAAPSLYGGLGFRVHPALEITGGMEWLPGLSDSEGLEIGMDDNGTSIVRNYTAFWMYSGVVSGRMYPFFKKPWKTEPYLTAGYRWSTLIPKGSGDSFSGSGWLVGLGALYPLTTHWFLEPRLTYGVSTFDSVSFLGRSGSLSPDIVQNQLEWSLGISYRL